MLLAALVANGLAASRTLQSGQSSPPKDESATVEKTDNDPTAPAAPSIPFEDQVYRVKVICSFANDTRITARLREDVLRRVMSHSWLFVGRAWQIQVEDVTQSLAAATPERIAELSKDAIEAHTSGVDKVFVLGVRAGVDRFHVAAREFDVTFGRWGPVFQASSRETTQIARDLVGLAGRMFCPLAQVDSGDRQTVTIRIRGGRLPTLNPKADSPNLRYKHSLLFVDPGTLFRPMLIARTEEGVVESMEMMPWSFYEVISDDAPFAKCRMITARRTALIPPPATPDEAQLIAARTAGGSTELHVIDTDTETPLAALEIRYRDTTDGPLLPIGTTSLDGRITIPQGTQGLRYVWVQVRLGRILLAMLPVLPGAGVEPSVKLRADTARLDVESQLVAVQEHVIDQIALRKVLEGKTKSVIKTKKWQEAEQILKMLEVLPRKKAMSEKLDVAKKLADAKLGLDKPAGKSMLRFFIETEGIIESFFVDDDFVDLLDNLSEEIKAGKEEAAQAAAEAQAGSGR